MSSEVTVGQLPEVALDRKGRQIFLYCPECGAEYSATQGDYFWMPAGEVMFCENVDFHRLGLTESLQLRRRVTRIVRVKACEL